MEILRKIMIADKIAELVKSNKDISVARLFCLILRSKGRKGVSEEPFDLTDENLLVSLSSLEKELYERDYKYDRHNKLKEDEQ
jgi:hypothetical protein